MAFFTRFCRKFSGYLHAGTRAGWLAFCISSFCVSAIAASSVINIKQAELAPLDDFFALSAIVDISFDNTIEEAINKGVPLHFLVEFQVVTPRKYWFDDEIVTVTDSVVLSYHALTRQYLVNRASHQKSFETLDEAAQELMEIDDWKVLDKALIEKNEVYNAALLIRLDQTKLPKAIQVDAIASEKWNLSSQKYVWALKELGNSKELNAKESK